MGVFAFLCRAMGLSGACLLACLFLACLPFCPAAHAGPPTPAQPTSVVEAMENAPNPAGTSEPESTVVAKPIPPAKFAADTAKPSKRTPSARPARTRALSARSVFFLLPTTIFENTVAGLEEDEKHELLTQGSSEHWAVRKATADVLELVSRPDEDSVVQLCLFRKPGQTHVVAAMGTNNGPMCATELWSIDSRGRATPLPTPPEPYLYDFFAPGAPIPADVTASLPFCVHPKGLEVRPLFWTSTGVAHVMVDNAVFYLWTGDHFSKRIITLAPYPSQHTALPQGDELPFMDKAP